MRRLKRCAMAAMRQTRSIMNSSFPGHAPSSRGCAGGETHPMKRHLFVAALGISFFAWNTTAFGQQVKAYTGGIAIGGSVTNSTINITGVPPEQLAALVRQAADLSETQKKLIAK